MRAPVVWFVVPCYNEEAVLPQTAPLFLRQVDRLVGEGRADASSRILFVDDGSSDGTWAAIEALSASDPRFVGLSLSRNRGHQNALLAGLMEAKEHCDAAISADCDGQDDITVSRDMIDAFLDGNDVVYGVRSKRDTDTAFKRTSAEKFYTLMNALGAEVVFNHADYRLMSRRALEGLSQFSEVNLFLRGLVPLVGFPSTTVEYERAERMAGESHYPLSKMLHLAVDGITSLSIKPIRIIAGLGIVFSLVGLIGVVWAIVAFALGSTVAGWASMLCVVSLIGGLQLLSLGVIGEYIGKIYLEVKRRPRYLVKERTWDEGSDLD